MNYIEKKRINKSIEKEVVKIVNRLASVNSDKPENVGLNEPLVDYFDSLDAVECIMEMEKHFEIAIMDEDAEKITTISECCAMLRNKYLISTIEERSEKLKNLNELK